jgi:hypothetical protein
VVNFSILRADVDKKTQNVMEHMCCLLIEICKLIFVRY